MWGLFTRPARHFLAWVAAALLGLSAACVFAQPVQPVPALSGRVIDRTATLSAEQSRALEDKLAAFESAAGAQIVVLLVPTTAPEDIAAYANRVADTWKIGRRDVGDGLLLVVAKDDRRVRIEVARALEGAVPDLAARQIIDGAMRPAFRAGDYAGGIESALEQLMARVRGEALPPPDPQWDGPAASTDEPTGLDVGEWVPLIFVLVLLGGSLVGRLLGRKRAATVLAWVVAAFVWWLTASVVSAVLAAALVWVLVGLVGVGTLGALGARGGHGAWRSSGGGSWSSGSSSGGLSGGGFSSGGGGSFGGGGASGSW